MAEYYIRISQTVTVSTSPTTLFSVPSPYIARLERLSITNPNATGALVQLFSLNGSASAPILTLELAAGSTVIYREDQVPRQATPTGFSVTSNVTPIYVDFTVTLE